MTMDDIVTIYIHIPKTAGTTLRSVVDMQFEPDQVIDVYGDNIERAHDYLVGHPNRQTALWVRGHISFGCHTAIGRPYRYVTLLRHPVARVKSLYNYILRDRMHHLYTQVKETTLRGFALDGLTCETDNGMCRQLCGSEGEFPQQPDASMVTPFGRCGQEMLDQTFANLEKHFTVVGITDMFDESLRAMCLACGWMELPYRRRNVSQPRKYDSGVDRDIARLNSLDVELYEVMRKQFERRLQ
jgi:hypothetical protein